MSSELHINLYAGASVGGHMGHAYPNAKLADAAAPHPRYPTFVRAVVRLEGTPKALVARQLSSSDDSELVAVPSDIARCYREAAARVSGGGIAASDLMLTALRERIKQAG